MGKYYTAINPDCAYHTSDTKMLNFVGIIMGLLFVLLPTAVFKFILGEERQWEDLLEMGDSMHRRLEAMITGKDTFEHYFCVNYVDLIPHGSEILVDEGNCAQFVKLMIKYLTEDRFKGHIEALKQGFLQVIPRKHLDDFTADELRTILCHLDPVKFPVKDEDRERSTRILHEMRLLSATEAKATSGTKTTMPKKTLEAPPKVCEQPKYVRRMTANHFQAKTKRRKMYKRSAKTNNGPIEKDPRDDAEYDSDS